MSSPYSDLARPPLRQPDLRRALQAPHGPWRAVEVVAQTGSTNADVAARAAAGEPHGLVLVADQQSAGRGRLHRSWTTPPRAAVAVSVLLRPQGTPAHRLGWLSLIAALAVSDTLIGRCGLPARLKWPNDVLVAMPGGGVEMPGGGVEMPGGGRVERKVCGILAEAVPGGTRDGAPSPGMAVVVGAGINVTQTEAELPTPTGTALPATSLRLAGAAVTDRDTLVRDYLRRLAVRYADLVAAAGDPQAAGQAAAYRERCATLGREVTIHVAAGDVVRGVAEEVDGDGRLIVRVSTGPESGRVRAFAAGDVVHSRPVPS